MYCNNWKLTQNRQPIKANASNAMCNTSNHKCASKCHQFFTVEELEDHLSQMDGDIQEKKQKITALESQAKQKEVSTTFVCMDFVMRRQHEVISIKN